MLDGVIELTPPKRWGNTTAQQERPWEGLQTVVEEKDDTKPEEPMLSPKPDKLETAIMANLWDTVLSQSRHDGEWGDAK